MPPTYFVNEQHTPNLVEDHPCENTMQSHGDNNEMETKLSYYNNSPERLCTPQKTCEDVPIENELCFTPPSSEPKILYSNIVEPDDDDSYTGYSCSSYGSSWCSSVVVPVVRPLPRRAPSPTPEEAFALLSGPPTQQNASWSQTCNPFSLSNRSGVFSPTERFCGNNNHEDSAVDLLNLDSAMGLNNNDDTLNETLNDTMNDIQDNSSMCCIPYDVSEVATNLDFGGYCHSMCGENQSYNERKRYGGLTRTTDDSISSNSKNSSSNRSSSMNYKMSQQYSGRQGQGTNPVWWIRRNSGMVLSKRRRRRSSPVFDNMPVVPESPTVSTCSSRDLSDMDESPVPSSPPDAVIVTPSPLKREKSVESMFGFEAATRRSSWNYNDSVHTPSVSVQPSNSHNPKNIHPYNTEYNSTCLPGGGIENVPMYVICNDMEEDNYSMCSWASHSFFRSDASSYTPNTRSNTSVPNSSNTVSSESISLPVMIGPAYKFTPIERDCSFSETGSYEKPYLNDYEDFIEDGDYEIGDGHGIDHEEVLPMKEQEVWSVFDMPLLLSKAICDWAVGTPKR